MRRRPDVHTADGTEGVAMMAVSRPRAGDRNGAMLQDRLHRWVKSGRREGMAAAQPQQAQPA